MVVGRGLGMYDGVCGRDIGFPVEEGQTAKDAVRQEGPEKSRSWQSSSRRAHATSQPRELTVLCRGNLVRRRAGYLS